MVGSGPVHTQYTIFDSMTSLRELRHIYIYYIYTRARTHICIYVPHESRNILYMNNNNNIYICIYIYIHL